MKRQIFFLVFLFLMGTCGFSAGALTEQISQIENSYFGYNFPSDSDIKRIERLEKAVYGKLSQGSEVKRAQKLYNDLQANLSVDESDYSTSSTPEELPEAEKDVRYPVVDKIEQKVFKKTYQNEDIYLRLSRLEKQVFKKESNSSLNERVDNLRNTILGSVALNDEAVNIRGYDPLNDSDDDLSDNSHYNYYSPQNTRNRVAKPDFRTYDTAQNYDLDMLEKTVFNRKFSGETPAQRLARLENSVFNKTFSDADDSRIQRLLAATTAQKTSRNYDNNTLMQRLNTGMQIGGIILMVLAMIL